jgi:hypothetical protein
MIKSTKKNKTIKKIKTKHNKRKTFKSKQYGGGKVSAKNLFINRLLKNVHLFDEFLTNFNRDLEKDFFILSPEEKDLLSKLTKQKDLEKTDLEQFFEIFYRGLLKLFPTACIVNNYIDFITKSYLSNTFGNPSSLENISRFQRAIQNYEKLNNNKHLLEGFNITPIDRLDGLINLEDYIGTQDSNLEIINTRQLQKTKKKENAIKKEKEGTMEPFASFKGQTHSVFIFQPETEAQSKYYGSGTRWCTAADNNNEFESYKYDGKLYIFIKKESNGKMIKFQLHFASESLMDSNDNPINFDNVLSQLTNDDEIKESILKCLKEQIIPSEQVHKIKNFFDLLDNNNNIGREDFKIKNKILEESHNLQGLTLVCTISEVRIIESYLTPQFNKPLNDSLSKFQNLESLTLPNDFNQDLDLSLSYLKNLKELVFGTKFNKPLGESLFGLVNLESLQLSDNFNQDLGKSLSNLKNLKNLFVGNSFNQEFKDSLSNLKKLKKLLLGRDFNQKITDSLEKLPELEYIRFSRNFDQDFENLRALLQHRQHIRLDVSPTSKFGKFLLNPP